MTTRVSGDQVEEVSLPPPPSPEHLNKVKTHTQNIINTHHIDYAAQNRNATCDFTTVYEQEQQKFISKLMSDEDTPIHGMVLWHGLGSGKTLTSILTTRENNRNVVVFAPASLIGNYKREIDFAVNNNLLQKLTIEDYRAYYTENTTDPQCNFSEELAKHKDKEKQTNTTRKNVVKSMRKTIGKIPNLKRKGGGNTRRKKKSNTLKKRGGTIEKNKKRSDDETAAAYGLLSLISPLPPPPQITERDIRAQVSAVNALQALRLQPPQQPSPQQPSPQQPSPQQPSPQQPSPQQPSPQQPSPQPQTPPPTPKENIDLLNDAEVLKVVRRNKMKCNKQSILQNDIKFPKNKKFVTPDGKTNVNTYYFYSSNGDLNTIELSDYKYYFRMNSFIVFDESQLFISKIYNSYKTGGSFYNFYERLITNFHKNNLRVLFLSGTPIVNNPAELAILFNMLKGDKTLFDVGKFNEIYALQDMPAKYEYNFTNQQREQQLSKLLNDSTIKNAEDFKKRTYGLLSYFGNIKSLLPEVSLDPAVLQRSISPLPADLKYGYNNDGKPLFFIKECVMTSEQYRRVHLLDILIELLSYNSDKDSLRVINEYLVNFKSISYDVAVKPSLYIEYEGVQIDIIQKIYDIIQENPNITADQIFSSSDEKYQIIKDKIIDIKIALNIPRQQALLKTLYERREAISKFFHNYLATLEELINTPEAMEFINDTTTGSDVLHDYSCKIYEICKTIKQNPTKKHIIYCESRRVNVILARALRAYCGMKEYMGAPSAPASTAPEYMFLTGSGNDTEDILFKYYQNEGKLRVNQVRKEEMIDYFNGNDRIKVVILNSAAAEGITLKQVNFVHLLQVPPNMSRLYQIVGRAIRNCTHKNAADKTVTPLLYIAVPPPEVLRSSFKNRDIKSYEEIVNNNDKFLPYLNLLKNSSVDCPLTKQIQGNESMPCFIGGRRRR